MSIQQWIIFGTILLSLVLFVAGRWRYDLVALLALLSVTLTGLVPAQSAFSGFGNPAVITVAAVLVISRALQNSGAIDLLGERLLRIQGGVRVQLAALTGMVTVLSAFMNNIGALALLMPVAIQVGRKRGIPVSALLMPLAFASLLGGLTTLIGTPPNIIVASYRIETGAPPFAMFDFAPVGVGVALAGLLFLVLIGWRLIPARRGQDSGDDLFEVEKYITEVRLTVESRLVGESLRAVHSVGEGDVNFIGLVRNGVRRLAPSPGTVLQAADILILQIDADDLEALVAKARLELVGSERIVSDDMTSEEVTLLEVVVTANSLLVGNTAFSLDLRKRFGVNLLAVSRQGQRLRMRLDRIVLRPGDVLLLQVLAARSKEVLATLGCLPLAQRELRIGQPQQMVPPLAIFGAAILLSSVGLLPVQIAFVAAAVLMVMAGFISLREAYGSIDWPIIILLGAMIPVGEALETSGGAQLIADSLLHFAGRMSPVVALAAVMVMTMFLSDLVNNAAAVVLAAPIGISVAYGLGAPADPFLMAVAVGASCAFLTPIGHQSNTLVMGPGGYHFGDYWRMGLLLEVIVLVVAIPLIMAFWPLEP